MKGWIVELNRKDFPKCGYVLSAVVTWNPKMKEEGTPLMFGGRQWLSLDDYSDGNIWVFEEKDEAKEFVNLLKRFQTLNMILTKTTKESEYHPISIKIKKVDVPKIIYADFDQIMDSFDGFEEKMEKAAKLLAKKSRKKVIGK